MFYPLIICLLVLFSSFSLKEKVQKAHAGEFVVTELSKNYSILFIRDLTATTLYLEEITAPEAQVKSLKNDWKGWIKRGAPGHTAWVVYTIDLEKNKMTSCYSFDRKGWLAIDDRDSFLTSLFSLPLARLEASQRKRIGPPPPSGETDRRSLWIPPVFIEGKKIDKPLLEVFKSKWPEDDTPLSRCEIHLYFDTNRPSFLFPCWIEVKSPHYTQHLKVVDSGTELISFHKFLPNQELRKF